MDVINSLLRAARAGNLKRVIDFIEDDLVDINSSNQNGLTALHSASKEGHIRVVEELISRGANVHAKTHKGNTALHIASLAGHEPVVRLLIETGADVDAQSASGFTALYMAAQENHESIVKLLLANKANQNIATTDGFTPLAVAMQQGHEQIASILLNNEAKGRIRFPGTTESGRSLLHIAAKKNDCTAAALLMQNNISPDIVSKSGFTALHVACHYGNKNIAKLLIDRQADVNFQAKHNITPLHVAAKWGKEELVELLLEEGAKIDAITKDGLTPLHCAARSGHNQVVEELIKRGAPISAKTRSGLAPLHMATQGDHHGSAQILLDYGTPVDDVTVDYLTALHVASHCGHVKVAKLLLNNKADPNFRALNGFTSLHIACKKNRLKVVELLLKYGASLNAVTESGLTPLHVASFMGCVQIVVYLLENHASIEAVTVRGETPLHLATRANQIEVIQVLLQYGAQVSARAKESQTALHIAARLGNADIAKLLLAQGIDVDAPTKDSYTALHIAAKEGHEEVVGVLLNHGANISCATRNHGFTPLHLASKYGIDGVVELLLSYGAPVDAQGKNGVTPLHVATHYDHPTVVELLLQGRASPHAMAKNGYTALHIAAKGNRLDIAQALLQHRANPNADSKAGFCPLHLAAQEGRTEMAGLLLNNGAQVNCRAKNGITPLHLCAQEDHVNVAQLLVKRGAYLDEQTKGGFTPLHVASHFARIKMIRFLLANGANVNIPAASGYTPLHQASQQGNPEIVKLLLQYNAKPDALTESGQTALSIAQNLGYVSIIDTLKVVTETIVKTTTMTITEEKFKIVAPETMQETFVSDSEDEADDTAHAESVKFLTTDVMKNFNSSAMAEDNYSTSQSNLANSTGASRQQLNGGQPPDEMQQDLNYLSREAPLDGGESTFGAAASYSQLAGHQDDDDDDEHLPEAQELHQNQLLQAADEEAVRGRQLESPAFVEQLGQDNVDIQRPMQQSGSVPARDQQQANCSLLQLKPFLVSFMVDARGGAMRGCRHSGVRVIIPPASAQMPMRITCRYLRRERLVHPPPLMEGEACASKIMEVGPAGAKFLGPVLIEVPHFASLRDNEREIIILRSDSGEVWREHLVEADERLVESIVASAEDQENQQQQQQHQEQQQQRRLTRIVTTEFPQYFAIISRVRQEVHAVGPAGSTVQSQQAPKVQATFPPGALKKRIKIGLQKKENNTEEHAEQESTEQDPDRAQSPQSSQTTKRRSRFLACFGAGQGSIDLLNSSDGSATGGDSPRQTANEKLVERRHILGDVSDSEEPRSSPSPSSSLQGELGPVGKRRNRRQASPEELVPDDYYIEREPALILNMRPKTYGKRLASSSAQTDAKLQSSGQLTTWAKSPANRRRAGLLRGRRKQKGQMTIVCDAKPTRPKSAQSQATTGAPDSSLETNAEQQHQQRPELELERDEESERGELSSIIEDVISSQDHKWRTCTIQTDSDSVTVNYVLSIDRHAQTTGNSSGPDDGYVSDLPPAGHKKNKSSKLFGSKLKSSGGEAKERKRPRRTKSERSTGGELESFEQSASLTAATITTASGDEQQQPDSLDRSISPASAPTGKELKQRQKDERRELARREKEAKRLQKEQEELAAKAEKLRRKEEKEAAKRSKKAQGRKSPSPPPPAPVDELEKAAKGSTVVKFANQLVEASPVAMKVPEAVAPSQPEQAEPEQLDDSLQKVIETTEASYAQEKERLSQEDGHDMVRLSFSGDKPVEAVCDEDESSKLISISSSSAVVDSSELADQQQSASLRPILKQSSAEDGADERNKLATKLVDEATEEAVRSVAGSTNELSSSSGKAGAGETTTSDESKKISKAEKKRLAAEAKRLAKDAAEAKRAAELEAKRLAKEAKSKAEREAKEAKLAAEKAVAEAKAKAKAEVEAKKKLAKTSKLSSAQSPEAATTSGPATGALVEEPSVEEGKESRIKKKDLSRDMELSDMEPESTSTSTSFLGRLFSKSKSKSKSKRPPKAVKNKEKKNSSLSSTSVSKEEKTVEIMSEMYPSDPDDADGEMILEVNVPEGLIETSNGRQQPITADFSLASLETTAPTTSPTPLESGATATTIDESLATSASERDYAVGGEPIELAADQLHKQLQDDQATLVNVSQVASSPLNSNGDCDDDGDEATENVMSQTADVALDSVRSGASFDETVAIEVPPASSDAKPTKVEAKSEDSSKAKRELEAKLEREAKKQKKEEAKLRERERKSEEMRLKAERKEAERLAKVRAKEEKVRAKAAAKSAKRLADLAKKEAKSGRKSQATSQQEEEKQQQQHQEEHRQEETIVVDDEGNELDLSKMRPVNEETEVERIVEEVVDEDGVVTRTTKLIETKLVTLRQEEVRVSERRDLAADEYERLQQQQQQQQHNQQRSVPKAGAVHPELDEICATPSYFAADNPAPELQGELSPKKLAKRRIKLNGRLVKRALKLAKSEASRAKSERRRAEAEIGVCDEAAKEARKEQARAEKLARKANKATEREHKRMDKMDKKLAKRQAKLEKRQRKLDKEAARRAEKEANRREKVLAREAKLERKASQKSAASGGSRRSIKIEDIGEPQLRSSSRPSLGVGVPEPSEMVRTTSDVDGDIQVELDLDVDRAPKTESVEGGGGGDGDDDEEIDVVSELPAESLDKLKQRLQEASE